MDYLFRHVHPRDPGPFTHPEVAAATGLSTGLLSTLRSGKNTNPTKETQERLAGFFGYRSRSSSTFTELRRESMGSVTPASCSVSRSGLLYSAGVRSAASVSTCLNGLSLVRSPAGWVKPTKRISAGWSPLAKRITS